MACDRCVVLNTRNEALVRLAVVYILQITAVSIQTDMMVTDIKGVAALCGWSDKMKEC